MQANAFPPLSIFQIYLSICHRLIFDLSIEHTTSIVARGYAESDDDADDDDHDYVDDDDDDDRDDDDEAVDDV